MELALQPHDHLSPLEALLTIYTPILECLVSHLPTPAKLALAQSSRYLRQLLYAYPLFFAHLDFRLGVFESPSFDSYRLGTVYNLDCLLQKLPVEGRIVSLTLDWTAVSGYFLFNRIIDRCQHTLEHLSVRGCRKVSIKHHIVPHFVYQDMVEPLDPTGEARPKRALKSLYVYKARGVRRKPFLIDRKPADGDEPSRYLTTLAEKLGIWVDLGLCPTPKLRCPRRREILRRGKEKFCVPFDRRWRVQAQENNAINAAAALMHLSPAAQAGRQRFEQSQGEGIVCDNCDAAIPDRCEACVQQMTCSNCQKALCHECAYTRPTPTTNSSSSVAGATAATAAQHPPTLPPQQQQQNNPWAQLLLANPQANPPALPPSIDDAHPEPDTPITPSHLLHPCCKTVPISHADNLCSTCFAANTWASCDGCSKQLCIKHELERCRRCEGGCSRTFCFSIPDSTVPFPGCGELESGKAGMKDCLTCGIEVCADCRMNNSSSSPLSDDDDEASVGSCPSPVPRTACSCKVCLENYYCPGCWPTKPVPCEPRPDKIVATRSLWNDSLVLWEVAFLDDENKQSRWYTLAALWEFYPTLAGQLISEYEVRRQMEDVRISSGWTSPSASSSSASSSSMFIPPLRPPPRPRHPGEADLQGIDDDAIEVAENEFHLHKVLTCKPHSASSPGSVSTAHWMSEHLVAPPPRSNHDEMVVLCKWLGRSVGEVSWVNRVSRTFEPGSREEGLVREFLEAGAGVGWRGAGGAAAAAVAEDMTGGVRDLMEAGPSGESWRSGGGGGAAAAGEEDLGEGALMI